MKKFANRTCTKKKVFCIALIMGLIFAMSSTVFASDDEHNQELIPNDEISSDLIREVLTSMFDDEPFIAEFNPNTGKILFYETNGKLLDWYRYNYTEEMFWQLVRANYIAANPVFCAETGERIRKNTTVHDYRTRNIYEFDMDGNVVVTSFGDKMRVHFTYDENGNSIETVISHAEFIDLRETERQGMMRFYDYREPSANENLPRFPRTLLWSGTHNVQPGTDPRFAAPVGGRWFTPPSSTRFMDFVVFSPNNQLPSNMVLHAYFTNPLGTNSEERRNFRARATHWNIEDAPRDPYQARIIAQMPGMGGSWPVRSELYFS